ncbi:hypothetical protein OH77DRAFT_178610 [Trametes cingulata]|nr:hypothetical protein OH77DRAFT_178610 [Trametes cingulata]
MWVKRADGYDNDRIARGVVPAGHRGRRLRGSRVTRGRARYVLLASGSHQPRQISSHRALEVVANIHQTLASAAGGSRPALNLQPSVSTLAFSTLRPPPPEKTGGCCERSQRLARNRTRAPIQSHSNTAIRTTPGRHPLRPIHTARARPVLQYPTRDLERESQIIFTSKTGKTAAGRCQRGCPASVVCLVTHTGTVVSPAAIAILGRISHRIWSALVRSNITVHAVQEVSYG